jgi:hypothetical protein
MERTRIDRERQNEELFAHANDEIREAAIEHHVDRPRFFVSAPTSTAPS